MIYKKVKIKVHMIVNLPALCGWENRSLKEKLLSVSYFVLYVRTQPTAQSEQCTVCPNGRMAAEYRYSGKDLLSYLWYIEETVLEEMRKNMKI